MDLHVCPHAFSGLLYNGVRRLLHKPQEMLAAYVHEADSVADIGCGPGYFSVALAEMVGSSGAVYAVDIQQCMLDTMLSNAKSRGVPEVITPVLASPTSINLEQPIDFALAFWMLHESRRPSALMEQIHACLKPGGVVLIAEPRIHVNNRLFSETREMARQLGLSELDVPKVRLSRSLLLQRAA